MGRLTGHPKVQLSLKAHCGASLGSIRAFRVGTECPAQGQGCSVLGEVTHGGQGGMGRREEVWPSIRVAVESTEELSLCRPG